MVAGKLFVRARYPGTGTVRVLLVGRLMRRARSAARTTARSATRPTTNAPNNAETARSKTTAAFFTINASEVLYHPSCPPRKPLPRHHRVTMLQVRAASAKPEQNRDVLAHLIDQRSFSLGMKFRFASCPIHTLQLIYQHRALYLTNRYRQRERIRFALACERTNYRQPARAIVALIGKHQRGTPLRLFTAHLRIEFHHHNVPGLRDVRRHHSTISLPTSAPADISESRFSAVIWETSCVKVGTFVARRSSTRPSTASISSESPSRSLASSTAAF